MKAFVKVEVYQDFKRIGTVDSLGVVSEGLFVSPETIELVRGRAFDIDGIVIEKNIEEIIFKDGSSTTHHINW
jgi:hypothetical protein